jgi:hypothetical protein
MTLLKAVVTIGAMERMHGDQGNAKRECPPRARRILFVLAFDLTIFLAGCAGLPTRRPELAPRYYGVWVQINPRYLHWWVLSAEGATAYAVDTDRKCRVGAYAVMGPNEIDIHFEDGFLRWHTVEGDMLLMEAGPRLLALYERAKRSDICRKPDGTYYERDASPAS